MGQSFALITWQGESADGWESSRRCWTRSCWSLSNSWRLYRNSSNSRLIWFRKISSERENEVHLGRFNIKTRSYQYRDYHLTNREWVWQGLSNYINCFLWGVITHPFTKFEGGVVIPPLNLYHITWIKGFALNQWETALLSNDVSHWLGASLESAMDK